MDPELGMFPQPVWVEWLRHPTGASLRSACLEYLFARFGFSH